MHATSAAATFNAEQGRRLLSGEAGAELGGLMHKGLMTGVEAVAVLKHADTPTRSGGHDDALMALEKAAGGDSAVEVALGQLMKTHQAKAADVVSAVKAGAAAGHDSVDMALTRVNAAALGDATVQAEMRRRVVSGEAAADFADAIRHGSATEQDAIKALASEVAKGIITDPYRVRALTAIERAGAGDAGIETLLGQYVRAGKLSAAAAIAAVKAGAAVSHDSYDKALGRLSAGSGDNATIEAEQRARTVSGATAADLVSAISHGMMTDSEAAAIVAAKVANGAVTQTQEAWDLLKIERTGVADVAIETALGQLVHAGKLSANAAIAAASAGASSARESLDLALLRLDDGAGGNAQIGAKIVDRVNAGSTLNSLSAMFHSGQMSSDVAVGVFAHALDLAGGNPTSQMIALAQKLGHGAGLDGGWRPPAADAAIASWVSRGVISGTDAANYASAVAYVTNDYPPTVMYAVDKLVPGGSPELENRIALSVVQENWGGGASVGLPGDGVIAAMADQVVRIVASAGGGGDGLGQVLAQLAPNLSAAMRDPYSDLQPAFSALQCLSYGASESDAPSIARAISASLMGGGPGELAKAVSDGTVSPESAVSLASGVVATLQQHGGAAGTPALPGMAEAAYVLAKLDAAAQVIATTTDQYGFAGALHAELQDTYGVAIGLGQTLSPLIDTLGHDVATVALTTGQTLASIADPTTGAEAKTIVDLEAAARDAGVSVDAALSLASFEAGGRSEVLKLEMTDRLLSGRTANDLADLTLRSALPIDAPLAIMRTEVYALAASSSSGSALGYDRDTALGLVAAKFDMTLRQMHDSLPLLVLNNRERASGLWDHTAPMILSRLASQFEDGNAKLIVAGVGALLGQAGVGQGSGTPSAATAAEVATLTKMYNFLMPQSVAEELAKNPGVATASPQDAQDRLKSVTEENVKAFVDSYNKGTNLATFEKEWAQGHKTDGAPISHDVSASLQTYQFTELGATVGATNATTFGLGGGFNLTISETAAATGSVTVDATQVTVAGAAGASAVDTLDLDGHARVTMMVQAIASGSVTAGITGVAVNGNVGVSESVTVTQTEQGALGGGFEGMQTTSLQAGLQIGADGSVSVGLNNKAAFGARMGVYASAGEEGNISYGGVTVGGGATIMSPGVVGYATDVNVDFTGGNIKIGVDQFIGVDLFGAEFKFDLTLPTGAVVSRLQNLGGVFEDVGETIASNVADATQNAYNTARDWASDHLKPAELVMAGAARRSAGAWKSTDDGARNRGLRNSAEAGRRACRVQDATASAGDVVSEHEQAGLLAACSNFM